MAGGSGVAGGFRTNGTGLAGVGEISDDNENDERVGEICDDKENDEGAGAESLADFSKRYMTGSNSSPCLKPARDLSCR